MLFSKHLCYLCFPLEGDTSSKPWLAPADGSDESKGLRFFQTERVLKRFLSLLYLNFT